MTLERIIEKMNKAVFSNPVINHFVDNFLLCYRFRIWHLSLCLSHLLFIKIIIFLFLIVFDQKSCLKVNLNIFIKNITLGLI